MSHLVFRGARYVELDKAEGRSAQVLLPAVTMARGASMYSVAGSRPVKVHTSPSLAVPV
jgi:hypothetical protein